MKAKAKVEAEARAAKKAAEKAKATEKVKAAADSGEGEEAETKMDGEDSGSESEAELVHEALKSPSARRARENKGQTSKYVPPDESAADRDRRTLFVGNLPVSATEKAGTAALKRHLLSFAPSAKIESVRFRSVAFSAPTSGPDPSEKKPDAEEEAKEASRREAREKERAAAWKATQAGSSVGGRGNRRGDDEVTDKSKSFLDNKGKRKVAFIKKDVSRPYNRSDSSSTPRRPRATRTSCSRTLTPTGRRMSPPSLTRTRPPPPSAPRPTGRRCWAT